MTTANALSWLVNRCISSIERIGLFNHSFRFRFLICSQDFFAIVLRSCCLGIIHILISFEHFATRFAIDFFRFEFGPSPGTCIVFCPFIHKTYGITIPFHDIIKWGLRCQYRHTAFLNPQVFARLPCSRLLIKQDPRELTVVIVAIELVLKILRKRNGRTLDIFYR